MISKEAGKKKSKTYLHPSGIVLSAPLNTAAMAWPPVMNMTFIVTNIPRWAEEAVSAKYIGTTMLARTYCVCLFFARKWFVRTTIMQT